MKRSLGSMMVAVNNGVSKKGQEATKLAFESICRVEQGDGETVTMKAADHAFVYGYLKACAKKAGLL